MIKIEGGGVVVFFFGLFVKVLRYLRFCGSAKEINDSTVVMASSVSISSFSVVTFFAVSLYKYSTILGARAWMYGVDTDMSL